MSQSYRFEVGIAVQLVGHVAEVALVALDVKRASESVEPEDVLVPIERRLDVGDRDPDVCERARAFFFRHSTQRFEENSVVLLPRTTDKGRPQSLRRCFPRGNYFEIRAHLNSNVQDSAVTTKR
jgi:hypothetical protein